jgi:uncharacterized protein (TIGR03086 family)
MEIIEALEQAHAGASRTIDGIRDDQWSAPSPCEEWDVRRVVEHVTGAVMMFTNAVGGQSPTPTGDDAGALYREAAKENLEAWRTPGALERTLELPFATLPGAIAAHVELCDVVQHVWDIARATGQAAPYDDELPAYALAFAQRAITDEFRAPRFFGPQVPCHDGAPVGDRLAAFLGRTP